MPEDNNTRNGTVRWPQLATLFPLMTYLLAAGAGFVTVVYGVHDRTMADVDKLLEQRLKPYVATQTLLEMRARDIAETVEARQGIRDRLARIEALLEKH